MGGKKIVLKVFVGIILVFILFIIAIAVLFMSINGKEQKDKETIYNGSGRGKVLIIYQESRMGLTKKAVNLASEEFQKAGYTVVTNHPRKSLSYNVQDYDVIVLSSPVYGAKTAEPLLEFEKGQDFSNKKVFVLLTGAFTDKQEQLNEVVGGVKNASVLKKIIVDKADKRISNEIKGLIG